MKPVGQWPDAVRRKRISRLKRRMKSCKDSRMQERYQTIYLYLQGYNKEEIAQITGRGLTTVYRYINAYMSGGLKALRLKHSPGRPAFLTEEQKRKVYDVVTNHVPVDVGFRTEMNWTAPLLQKWIEKEFGVRYSSRGTLHLLHYLGFSCTRPTYTLAKADPQKQEQFKKTLGTETGCRVWRA
jgi:transposase